MQDISKTQSSTKAKRVIRVIHKKLDASTTEKWNVDFLLNFHAELFNNK
jgi:hypothetical protein